MPAIASVPGLSALEVYFVPDQIVLLYGSTANIVVCHALP